MKKILLADDEPYIREVIRAMLEEEGKYEIFEAETGAQLIETAKQVVPDLIVADVIMPGLSGYRAVGQMRKDPRLENIPVIFNSASIKDKEMHESLKPKGPSYFLMKPFKYQELIPLVKKILNEEAQ
ncbi:MAG: response regulator [Elusimicrobia bacterium]|nr:response regulator [Elusimicrobiota bacterium]